MRRMSKPTSVDKSLRERSPIVRANANVSEFSEVREITDQWCSFVREGFHRRKQPRRTCQHRLRSQLPKSRWTKAQIGYRTLLSPVSLPELSRRTMEMSRSCAGHQMAEENPKSRRNWTAWLTCGQWKDPRSDAESKVGAATERDTDRESQL